MKEDILAEFRKKFVGKAPDYHDPNTHQNYPSEYTEKMLNIKDVEQYLLSTISKVLEETKSEIQGKKVNLSIYRHLLDINDDRDSGEMERMNRDMISNESFDQVLQLLDTIIKKYK